MTTPRFHEIEVALDQLAQLERTLKNPGGPVEDALAHYALRVAIVSVETVRSLTERRGALAG